MIVIEKYDDLAGNEDPPRMVKATESHRVSLDGEEVELDLSEISAAEVCGYLRKLIKIGKPTTTAKSAAAAKASAAMTGRITYYPPGPVKGRAPRDPGVSAYRFLLRTWCSDFKITRADDPSKLAYKTVTDGWNYPLALCRKFETFLDSDTGREWLETQDQKLVKILHEHRASRTDFMRIVASAH